jgi:hypothetical protein
MRWIKENAMDLAKEAHDSEDTGGRKHRDVMELGATTAAAYGGTSHTAQQPCQINEICGEGTLRSKCIREKLHQLAAQFPIALHLSLTSCDQNGFAALANFGDSKKSILFEHFAT